MYISLTGVFLKNQIFLRSISFCSIVLVFCLIAAGHLVPKFRPKDDNLLTSDINSSLLKLVTARYWPSAVELLWITLLQELAEKRISQNTAKEIKHFFDVATDLDPLFFELYEHAGISFAVFFEDGDSAINFLNKGIRAYKTRVIPGLAGSELSGNPRLGAKFSIRYWPNPAFLFIQVAYTEAYVRHDIKRAKEAFLVAANVLGAPEYLHNMSKWLIEPGSERRLEVNVLREMIGSTKDPDLKVRLTEKLKSVQKDLR